MGEMIQLTAGDGHQFGAYRADPAGTPKGGLVLIQEIFGVNEHIRDLCDQYAADGYAVIAPALYDRAERDADLGYDDEDRKKGVALRGQVSWEVITQDLGASAIALKDCGKVGVIGFCFGGSVAWVGADTGHFDAAVCYYGGGIDQLLDKSAKCPVMLHYGEADQGIPMEKVETVRAGVPDAAIHTYAGAGHGFVCDARASFHEEATRVSRGRTLEFFAQHIG